MDILIRPGRRRTSVMGISNKGVAWVKETFDYSTPSGDTMIDNESAEEVAALAMLAGLEVG